MTEPQPMNKGSSPPPRPPTSASTASTASTTSTSVVAASSSPSAPPPPHVSDETPQDTRAVLQRNELGVYKLAIHQITTTEFTRQLNRAGLKTVKKSVMEKGWLEDKTPFVLVSREQVPEGKDTVFTPEVLRNLRVRVLDGNHRVTALRDIKSPDYAIDCRLYMDFASDQYVNCIAQSLNAVTEAQANTTTYDKIYSTKFLLEAIVRDNRLSSAKMVTGPMMQHAHKQTGTFTPTNQILTSWKKLVLSLSSEAMAALKELSESDDKKIDISSLSKTNLESHFVSNLLEQPQEQAYFIHILARYKHVEKAAPRKSDFPAISSRAVACGELTRSTERVVPRELWTDAFVKILHKFVLGECNSNYFNVWAARHLKLLDEEVQSFNEQLPQRSKLSPGQVATVNSRLYSDLEKLACKTPELKAHVEAWAKKKEEVEAFVSVHRNGGDSSDDFEEEEEKEKPLENADKLCSMCNPSASGRYFCPKCGMRHMAWCNLTGQPDEDGPAERPCKECPTSKEGGKKRDGTGDEPAAKKKRGDTDIGDSAVNTNMARNFMFYEEKLITPRTKQYGGSSTLDVRTPPKLAVVNVCSEGSLFNATGTDTALGQLLGAVLNCIHPEGTLACAVPRPWLTRGSRIGDIFSKIESAVIEAHPLVVIYNAVAGGSVKVAEELHLRNQNEIIALIHKSSDGGKSFTCNKRAVPVEPHGLSSGPFPQAKQNMHLEALPNGAPNGSPRCFSPLPRVSSWSRVLGIGVEITDLSEVAIERGRSVELYAMDHDAKLRASVVEKVGKAFRKAHSNGMFQHRRGGEILVGPKVLPGGVPHDTTPDNITAKLENMPSPEDGELDGAAAYRVAKDVATACDYEFKGDFDSGAQELFARRRNKNADKSDMAVWGQFIVYDSDNAALSSLNTDDVDEQKVRLLKVANNNQLRIMLEPGKELCHPNAALFLRVASTCPLYWMKWYDEKEEADLDILCDIPQRGTRTKLLEKLNFAQDGTGGVKLRHARRGSTYNKRRALLVNPCARIVGAQDFSRLASSQGNNDDDDDDDIGEEGGVAVG